MTTGCLCLQLLMQRKAGNKTRVKNGNEANEPEMLMGKAFQCVFSEKIGNKNGNKPVKNGNGIKKVRKLRPTLISQDCNAVLKEIAMLCDIDIKLTTHIARHTFTVSYLDNGGRLEVLQKLL